jgi:hypothetical protein
MQRHEHREHIVDRQVQKILPARRHLGLECDEFVPMDLLDRCQIGVVIPGDALGHRIIEARVIIIAIFDI